MIRKPNETPNYILLTLRKDGTYTVDFFTEKERAEDWLRHDLNRSNNYSHDISSIAIYEPTMEVNND